MKRVFLLTTFALAILSANAQTATTDPGVKISETTWATRNVDAPGTFAANPKDYGMYYQWNSPVGWYATEMVNTNGDTNWIYPWNGGYETPSASDTWQTTNNVCPIGWRLPTQAELRSLLNAGCTWTTTPANGWILGSGNNTIFLPAAGTRYYSVGGLVNTGVSGNYWSSTVSSFGSAYYLSLSMKDIYDIDRGCGYSVRCVVDEDYVPNAVNDVSTDDAEIIGYYSVLGKKLVTEPASGIYIIIYDNGKTEKVVK